MSFFNSKRHSLSSKFESHPPSCNQNSNTRKLSAEVDNFKADVEALRNKDFQRYTTELPALKSGAARLISDLREKYELVSREQSLHCRKDLDFIRNRYGQLGRSDWESFDDLAHMKKLEEKDAELSTTMENLRNDIEVVGSLDYERYGGGNK